ncbi:amidohydrolase family protein [Trujillonella endophytica]|uniref:Predicted metal-dependent hydrolase, TIM-barrel fold n=1 Tax=Trujillonella endophytica TaxID=673521 RepID=A0A1H8TGX0_9ACTN|nr:amidohydrolase family protein [Trujillella endophytica]SEO90065.1 Predicted metal-dependent hydrolase, TIM-barrel fold [Trujillella endophytica]
MAIGDMLVVDADSHWSEPADMFTSRAPAKYKDQVPHVEVVDGQPSWVFNGTTVGMFAAGAVIAKDGTKSEDAQVLTTWTTEDVHVGAYDPKVRLEVLDECGIDHQVIFPSTIGLGGQGLSQAGDPVLQRLTIEIYNDAMAEIQAESGNRLLPMPLMPAYSVAECVREARRCAELGLRGVNMTSDPQDLGAPDLASHDWDPFWEVCSELEMPVHFHIGASVTAMTFYGNYAWASQKESTKLAIGGTLLFIGNARVVTNLILSGIFDRHPDLQTVSVESGVGWIPFILEALDYEMNENAKADLAALKKPPSEYFKSNMYATFWFENNRNNLPSLIESVGEDRILFETDFPHPTCLYPSPLASVKDKMETLGSGTQAKIYGENARRLYRL